MEILGQSSEKGFRIADLHYSTRGAENCAHYAVRYFKFFFNEAYHTSNNSFCHFSFVGAYCLLCFRIPPAITVTDHDDGIRTATDDDSDAESNPSSDEDDYPDQVH